MKKIAFIGAGSFQFTRNLVRDLMTYPAFQDAKIALQDINEEKLDIAKQCVEKIIEAMHCSATVMTSTNREEILADADGVVCTIAIGSRDEIFQDVEIPMKYGADYCVGDTRGVPGIFRGLRTWPVLLDIAKDIERLCPKAVFLSFTNPMALLLRGLQGSTSLTVTGLCHSVQKTAKMLSDWIGADYDKVTYTCAGVNHQAFYLNFKEDGIDAYPRIKKAIEEHPNEEVVRNDLYKHLGYYITESSGHASEYVSWYRNTPAHLEEYCTHGTDWNPGLHHMGRKAGDPFRANWKEEFLTFADDPENLKRGPEYASCIFNAIFGDNTPFEFNGNIRNFGLIDNLPYGCCVESPVLASKKGFEPIHVGPLPMHLAAIVSHTAMQEELAAEGMMKGDASKIYQACYLDPVASAVCSLEEIRKMVREMFEENKKYLGYFKSFED